MMITGYGIMMMFSTFFSTVSQAAYPPYGLSNISSVGLSFFMILVGLSYSAISVAQDVELRRYVKKSIESPEFLGSIGTAHMQQDIENKVMKSAKINLVRIQEQNEIQPSLTDQELRDYVNEVMNEVRTRKT